MDERLAYSKLKAEFERQQMLLEKQTKLASQLKMALEIVNRNLLKQQNDNEQLTLALSQTAEQSELLQATTAELKRTKAELSHLQQVEQAYEQQIEQITDELMRLEFEREQWQEEQRRAEEQGILSKQAYEDMHVKTAQEVAELKVQNEMLAAQLAHTNVENDAYKTRQQELEEQLSDFKQENAELVTKYDAIEQQYAYILEESTESQLAFEAQLAELTSQLDYMTEQYTTATTELAAKQTTIDTYETKMEQLEIEIRYLQTKKEEQQDKLEQLKRAQLQTTPVESKPVEQVITKAVPTQEPQSFNEAQMKVELGKLAKGELNFLDDATSIKQYIAAEFDESSTFGEALQTVMAMVRMQTEEDVWKEALLCPK